MAKPLSLAIQFTILLLFSSFVITLVANENEDGFVRTMDRRNLVELKKEKWSHFRVYWHDIFSGSNPSGVQITQPLNTSTTGFGSVRIIDNPLTLGPEMSSKLVGRAQGFYALASQEEIGILVVMNFEFIEGKYNGSTITVLGRNPVLSNVREMPVIGGSGLFRFARGFAQLRTHKLDLTTGDTVVQYDVSVLHF